jgi:hypothetical protein
MLDSHATEAVTQIWIKKTTQHTRKQLRIMIHQRMTESIQPVITFRLRPTILHF